MSTGTTLEQQLLRAAERADFAALQCTPQSVGVRWKRLRGIHEAEAREARQRAAWVRRHLAAVETAGDIPGSYLNAVRDVIRDLTGPIPSETAWAAPKEGTVKPYAEEPGRDYRKERDAAYTERNRLVAALARLLAMGSEPGRGGVAWLAEHEDDPNGPPWDPEWRTIVFIEGPTGQLSWHLHDSDVPLFDGLPRGPNSWDGHTTPEKYERVARIGRGGATAGEAKP